MNCLSVFDYFVGLVLKRVKHQIGVFSIKFFLGLKAEFFVNIFNGLFLHAIFDCIL